MGPPAAFQVSPFAAAITVLWPTPYSRASARYDGGRSAARRSRIERTFSGSSFERPLAEPFAWRPFRTFGHVVGLGAAFEVSRSAASRVVAGVKNDERLVAGDDKMRDAMGSLLRAVQVEAPVAVAVGVSGKGPAAIGASGSVDFAPEALFVFRVEVHDLVREDGTVVSPF